MDKTKKINLFYIIETCVCAIVAVVATFLPYLITFRSQWTTKNLYNILDSYNDKIGNTYEILIFVFCIIAIVSAVVCCALLLLRFFNVIKKAKIIDTIAGCFSILFGIAHIIVAEIRADEYFDVTYWQYTCGYGAWLILICCIMAGLTCIVFAQKENFAKLTNKISPAVCFSIAVVGFVCIVLGIILPHIAGPHETHDYFVFSTYGKFKDILCTFDNKYPVFAFLYTPFAITSVLLTLLCILFVVANFFSKKTTDTVLSKMIGFETIFCALFAFCLANIVLGYLKPVFSMLGAELNLVAGAWLFLAGGLLCGLSSALLNNKK